MVRYQWHVEDGLGASVVPDGLVYESGVLHATISIEVAPNALQMEASMTLPQNYNLDSGVRDVGVVLAHGSDVGEWQGRLLSEAAIQLAKAGFVVLRYICYANTDALRARVLEKVVDVAATCPYARCVSRWVLGGLGGGARVAALAGPRVRSPVAGYLLLSYPLTEAATGADGSAQPDSSVPLLPLSAPLLFVQGSLDPRVSEAALVALAPRTATSDIRCLTIPEVDAQFRNAAGKGPHLPVIRQINAALVDFLAAAAAWRMEQCRQPRVWAGQEAQAGAGAGAGAGAQGVEGAAAEPGSRAQGAADMEVERGEGSAAARPPLKRPACFKPIATGPPPPQQAPVPPPGMPGTAPHAHALAAQLQQQHGAGAHGRATAGGQHAGAGPGSAAAAKAAAGAGRGAAGVGANPLAAALSDPQVAAQFAVLLRQQQAVQAAAAGGDAAASANALTSALLQQMAQQQAPAAPLLASLMRQGQPAAAAINPQQLTQLLLAQQQQRQGQSAAASAPQHMQAVLQQALLQQQQAASASGGGDVPMPGV